MAEPWELLEVIAARLCRRQQWALQREIVTLAEEGRFADALILFPWWYDRFTGGWDARARLPHELDNEREREACARRLAALVTGDSAVALPGFAAAEARRRGRLRHAADRLVPGPPAPPGGAEGGAPAADRAGDPGPVPGDDRLSRRLRRLAGGGGGPLGAGPGAPGGGGRP